MSAAIDSAYAELLAKRESEARADHASRVRNRARYEADQREFTWISG